MNVSIEYVQDLPIVVISGRLDTVTAPAFDAHVGPFLATARPRMLLDLTQVTYVSSAGLRSVLRLIKHATAQGGRLAVFGAQPSILEVIEISGFPALIDLYPDRESALNAA
jgi:anti-sigma B factor antagonist